MKVQRWIADLRRAAFALTGVALFALAASLEAHASKQVKCFEGAFVPKAALRSDCSEAIRSGRLSGKGLAEAFKTRGDSGLDEGSFDDAIADYTQAIKLAPDFVKARVSRGKALQAKGALDAAIADYDESLRLAGRDPHVLNNRGYAHQSKGELDKALADFDEAIRLDPRFVFALNNRGNLHRLKGEFEPAIADYTAATRADPHYAMAFNNRGVAWMNKGDYDRAIADFDLAIKLDPKDPYAALWLEIADRRAGKPSRLAKAATQIDMGKWPASIVRLYLGQATFDTVFAAARARDAGIEQRQLCEANFYGGELALLRNAREEATRLLQAASAGCRGAGKTFWVDADADLKELETIQAGSEP